MAQSTMLSFGRDTQGMNAYAPRPATNAYSVTLAANTARSITVPANYQNWIVVFSISPTASVWVDFTGATAAVPAGNTFAATTSERNPAARTLVAGSVISVISANAQDVGITMYAINSAV
jgi:hypothetical protein